MTRPASSRVAATLVGKALAPLASNPELRTAINDVRKSYEQTIDDLTKDRVLFAGHSEEGRKKAAEMVSSFKAYIEEHKDDIRALQILYSRVGADCSSVLVRQHAGTRGGCRRAGPACGRRGAQSAQGRLSVRGAGAGVRQPGGYHAR